MYYKIRNDVLFRKYQGHGYITDNSEYGYRMLNDARIYPGKICLCQWSCHVEYAEQISSRH